MDVFQKEKLGNITLAFGGAAFGLQASLTVLSKLDMLVLTAGADDVYSDHSSGKYGV